MTEFICDDFTTVKYLKDNIQTTIDYDKFFTGLTFTTNLTDLDIKMLGCWNGECQTDLKISHKDSIQQGKINNLLQTYDKYHNVTNKFRFFFGDNIYYPADEKKIIKNKKNGEDETNRQIYENLVNLNIYDSTSSTFVMTDIIKKKMITFNPLQRAKEIIDKGFECINPQHIPTFHALGNHDVEFEYILKYQIQKSYINTNILPNNNITFSSWILPSAFYAVKFNVSQNNKDINLMFIIIDTNLLLPDGYENINSINGNIEEYKSRMFTWLKSILSDPSNEIYFKVLIGHQPIYNYKHKIKTEDKQNNEINNSMLELYNLLTNNVTDVMPEKIHTLTVTQLASEGESTEDDAAEEGTGEGEKEGEVADEDIQLQKIHMYVCADEHNLQSLYDINNNIYHIICGASPGGGGSDQAQTFDDQLNIPFSSTKILMPEDESFNIEKRLVLNSPSFLHLQVTPLLLQLNIIGPENLNLHNNYFCKMNVCEPNLSDIPIVYDIIAFPKYRDYIAIYKCQEYQQKTCGSPSEEQTGGYSSYNDYNLYTISKLISRSLQKLLR